jgi:hypothetical protein
MSDPMTNIGADDVLASIRRLVSETYDPKARKPKPALLTDRLVLSPDLRVVEGSKPKNIPAENPVKSESVAPLILEAAQEVTPPTSRTFEQVTPAQNSAAPVETKTETSGETQINPTAKFTATATSDDTVEDAVLAAQALMRDVPQASGYAPADIAEPADVSSPDADREPTEDPNTTLTLEERIVELEAAVETQFEDWQPEETVGYDGYEEDYEAEAPTAFSPVWTDPTARVLDFQSASAAKHANLEVDEAAFDKAETEAQKAEAPEAAVREIEDDDDDLALAGYSDRDLLDEGALRDMIAEVIREELQGTLGERITSNVRRLVRREVQRALTLREFD